MENIRLKRRLLVLSPLTVEWDAHVWQCWCLGYSVVDGKHWALLRSAPWTEWLGPSPAGVDSSQWVRDFAVDAVCRGINPWGIGVHQRKSTEHVCSGGDWASRAAACVHWRWWLQVGTDEDQVSARRLPGELRHQADIHCELQSPRQQRREESLSTATVPLKGGWLMIICLQIQNTCRTR